MAAGLFMAHDALAMTGYDDGPAVLVLADSEFGSARACATAHEAGARVTGTAPVQSGLQQLEKPAKLTAMWIEAEQDHGDVFDRLLERVDMETEAGRLGAVVCAPPQLIDVIVARTPHMKVLHLCEPTALERLDALRAAVSSDPTMLSDVNRAETHRLQQISQEVGRIANLLAELSEEEGLQAGSARPDLDGQAEIAPGTLRAIIRSRRLRGRFFGEELFADPAWDMMLDLMASRLEQRPVAVSSLCIAAAVPPTTALRWIKTLTEQGIFLRKPDPQDGRRVYVELSDATAAAFHAYLKTLPAMGSLLI